MRTPLVVGSLTVGILVTSLAFALPKDGKGDDTKPKATPAPTQTATPAPAPAPTHAPSATPPAAPVNSPLPSGNYDLIVISNATPGHPSQTLTLDAAINTTGATSTVTTRPVQGVTVASPTSLDLVFGQNLRCAGTATIDGAIVTLTGTATPTQPPSAAGTFTSAADGKTATGSFSLKLNLNPVAQMPLKVYGASQAPAASQSLWSRFKSWCGSFAL